MSADETPEARLMGRYCDGDATAFAELYRAIAPRLLGYLAGLAGDRATAADLLQQTMLKLHQSRAIYIRGADPVPWIYTIAHRTFLDEARRRKSSPVGLSQGGDERVEARAGLSGEPEAAAPAAGERDLSRATLEALAQLPNSQREALLLTKLQGWSVAEAAAIAGTTPTAIKLRAHRAYVTMRRLIGGERR